MTDTVEAIQWRNIKSAVKQLADFCFGSPDDPRWGTAHLAVTTSLTAKDGVALTLEPLPTYTPTGLYVVQRSDGKYLDIDHNSGGYPTWRKLVGNANPFIADSWSVEYITGLTESETKGPVDVCELMRGPKMTADQFVQLSTNNIREQALAKLTPAERQALGFK